MAYTKTNWVDETPGGPQRFEIEDDTLGVVAASAQIVMVSPFTPGTPMNAVNLNHLEQGVFDAHNLAGAAQTTANNALAAMALHLTKVRRAAVLSLTSGAITDLIHDTEDNDTDAMWVVGSPTLLTIPVGLGGWWEFFVSVTYANNGTGYRTTRLMNSGAVLAEDDRVAVSGNVTSAVFSMIVNIAAGQTVRVDCNQNSGGALNVTGQLIAVFRHS